MSTSRRVVLALLSFRTANLTVALQVWAWHADHDDCSNFTTVSRPNLAVKPHARSFRASLTQRAMIYSVLRRRTTTRKNPCSSTSSSQISTCLSNASPVSGVMFVQPFEHDNTTMHKRCDVFLEVGAPSSWSPVEVLEPTWRCREWARPPTASR